MTLPPWSPQDESKPAPGALLLVQAFVNTRDDDLDRDELEHAETAARWLALAGLRDDQDALEAETLHTTREFREGLRALLVRNGGGPAPQAHHVRSLQRAASGSAVALSVNSGGEFALGAETPGALEDGLVTLLVTVRDAQLDGTWLRLKACANPECQWAFYDASRNRRGTWCEMAVCGNRLKNRTFRARHSDR